VSRVAPASPWSLVTGELGLLPTHLPGTAWAGKGEDGGAFAVIRMGGSRGMSAYSHLLYSAVALALSFHVLKSGAGGPGFFGLPSNLSLLFA